MHSCRPGDKQCLRQFSYHKHTCGLPATPGCSRDGPLEISYVAYLDSNSVGVPRAKRGVERFDHLQVPPGPTSHAKLRLTRQVCTPQGPARFGRPLTSPSCCTYYAKARGSADRVAAAPVTAVIPSAAVPSVQQRVQGRRTIFQLQYLISPRRITTNCREPFPGTSATSPKFASASGRP